MKHREGSGKAIEASAHPFNTTGRATREPIDLTEGETIREPMNEAALYAYLSDIEHYHRTENATEQTYRGTLRNLLEALDTTVSVTHEPKRVQCGAPDYVVARQNVTIGYIEAKDQGSALDTIENDAQLRRYRRALDSLILTDSLEFRWYVRGEKRASARLATLLPERRLQMQKPQKAAEV